MSSGTTAPPIPTLATRFAAFVVERFPFAIDAARAAFDAAGGASAQSESEIERVRAKIGAEVGKRLQPTIDQTETTPGVQARDRFSAAVDDLVRGCDGFLKRAALRASLTADERREILRGMVLTRATDNRLKLFFTGGEVRYGDATFQGKGFRSLGQEAIYAAGIRLRRGVQYRDGNTWRG